ncbi:hypothetical protein HDU83_007607 [Entophlyctis luteolus]|nr:hypothetical protein HDU83_007607 [Entophlyctis luteolus]
MTSSHSAVEKFFELVDFDTEIIQRETDEKFDQIQQTISTYPSEVGQLDETDAFFASTNSEYLVPLNHATEHASQSARKLAKGMIDFSNTMTSVRHLIGRPKADFMPHQIQDLRFALVDTLIAIEDTSKKMTTIATVKLLEALFDSTHAIHSASRGLSLHNVASTEYKKASRDANQLSIQVSRLESTARTHPTEESVTKLSEVYFKFSEASKALKLKGSHLNYADMSLRTELSHYRSYRAKDLTNAVNKYVCDQLSAEMNTHEKILTLLGMK